MNEQRVELSQDRKDHAEKLTGDVLRRVKGHDDTAQSQAKYIAKHKASAVGMTPEERDAFLELVQDLITRAMGNRAAERESDQPPAIRSEATE